ncbi:MAG: bifunctional glutamate N-acetyltransferase/amino-acid acetyltransferase ArgJ [Acidimicrobiales bacterium]
MTVLSPRGFVASAAAAGIKPEGQLDLALVATEDARAVPVGAVFTSNLLAAAPVQVCRSHLAQSGGLSAGVVLNSGCANSATGLEGRLTAELTCDLAARALGVRPEHFLVCSTGTIGTRLAEERIEAALPKLIAGRGSSSDHAASAAKAILTTDTRTKEVVVEAEGFVVGGMAKGAAMLSPNMATMLAVLTTDASSSPLALHAALVGAVQQSFNEMTVDGCTSTNDSVIVMASGIGPQVQGEELEEALAAACADLATQMVADAEGGTKVVRVRVVGASDGESARRAARRVAESQLVKSSWYGEDPNWGRVVSELGSAGTPFDPLRASVAYGAVTVCRDGVAVDHDEEALREVLGAKQFEVTCDLGLGDGSATMLSADLTPAYVELNKGLS